MNRNDTRAAILGRGRSWPRKAITVTLAPGEAPVELEVRKPSYADQQRIVKAGGSLDEAKVDTLALGLEATLLCTYSPADGVRIFDEADRASLINLPGCQELVNAVAPVVLRLIGDVVTEKEAEKN